MEVEGNLGVKELEIFTEVIRLTSIYESTLKQRLQRPKRRTVPCRNPLKCDVQRKVRTIGYSRCEKYLVKTLPPPDM